MRERASLRASLPATRVVTLWAVGLMVVGLGVIGTMMAWHGFTPASLRWLIGLAVLGVPFWLGIPLAAARDRKRMRRIVEDGGRACLGCGYALAGLGAEGRCPECGEGYEAKRNAAAWRRTQGWTGDRAV